MLLLLDGRWRDVWYTKIVSVISDRFRAPAKGHGLLSTTFNHAGLRATSWPKRMLYTIYEQLFRVLRELITIVC